MMLMVTQGWRRQLTIVLAGGLLPVGYKMFPGWFSTGCCFPGTALVKDAGSDSPPRA